MCRHGSMRACSRAWTWGNKGRSRPENHSDEHKPLGDADSVLQNFLNHGGAANLSGWSSDSEVHTLSSKPGSITNKLGEIFKAPQTPKFPYV